MANARSLVFLVSRLDQGAAAQALGSRKNSSNPSARFVRLPYACSSHRAFSTSCSLSAKPVPTDSSATQEQTRRLLNQLSEERRTASSSLGGETIGLPLGRIKLTKGDGSGGTYKDKSLSVDVSEKKWGQLTGGQKVIRATRQTTNFFVIVLGGGLAVILAWAISTELFARNSPTVLFNRSVKQIRKDEEILSYLLPPIAAHGDPSLSRLRRNRRLASQIYVDQQGREHLVLRFFVEGTPLPPSGAPRRLYERLSSSGWLPLWASDFLRGVDDKWIESRARAILLDARDAAGEYLPILATPRSPLGANGNGDRDGHADGIDGVGEANDRGRAGWFDWTKGAFGSLTGLAGRGGGGADKDGERGARGGLFGHKPPPGTYSSGEVHADFVKDASGHFATQHLIVDIPSTNAINARRVYVPWPSSSSDR